VDAGQGESLQNTDDKCCSGDDDHHSVSRSQRYKAKVQLINNILDLATNFHFLNDYYLESYRLHYIHLFCGVHSFIRKILKNA
jgi:hypothetical protein